MSEATKHTSDASLSLSSSLVKKAKIDSAVFKHETDDEDSIGATPPLPTVSFERDTKAYKQETDDEGEQSDAASTTSAAATNPSASAAKKRTIMTFTATHDKFAHLQLLSTHTLYDLVSALCQHTPIGYEGTDGPDDHLWYITYNGKEYESSDIEYQSPLRANKTRLEELRLDRGSTLKLTYEYGSTSTYQITLVEILDLTNGDDVTSFPRNQPKSDGIPASYVKYQPSTYISSNLDIQFFYLNDWIFHNATSVSVNLFQAGRKKNYGFMDNKFTMIYLPTKPDSLADWLECFNRGASVKPAGLEAEGYTHYTWQSVVALPRSKLTPQLWNKYKSNERPGFCDAPIAFLLRNTQFWYCEFRKDVSEDCSIGGVTEG